MSLEAENSVQALQTLGFSELESAIYTFLLQQPPTTGYRIAHVLDKPVANTYKGIAALQAKGAVIIDDSKTRLCRAVPPVELFGQMERGLRQRCEQAAQALAKLKAPAEDERVYRLHTWEQVMERTRQMIGRAEQVVLISAFPEPLSAIQAELETAAQRGVGVLLKIYAPTNIVGAHIIQSNETPILLERFPAQELSLVVDAQEQLQALIQNGGQEVIQAIWSRSAFLAFNHYNGLYSEWLLTALTAQIHAGASGETLQATLKRAYPLMQTPGYHNLLHALNKADDHNKTEILDKTERKKNP